FQRLHGSDEGAGDGIGLAIADAIVARHGGHIRAEAIPGEGATFHVHLRDVPIPGGEQ
ncbi:MAG TPA: ATP-binding protein, partial [Thermomonas sp.]|nr:ATP-binding protein [Thermomonas sp.]